MYWFDNVNELENDFENQQNNKNENKKLKHNGHYKYKIPYYEIYTDSDGSTHREKKYRKFEYYGTPGNGARIRDAITGYKTAHISGSADEDLYFSVIMAKGNGVDREPIILFYDSPERYEVHQGKILNESVKKRWQVKFMAAQKRSANL